MAACAAASDEGRRAFPEIRPGLRLHCEVYRRRIAAVMLPFECTLSGAGELTFEMEPASVTEDMPEEALRGAIDVKAAIGIWLIGQPGWRKLDVIVLGRKYHQAG